MKQPDSQQFQGKTASVHYESTCLLPTFILISALVELIVLKFYIKYLLCQSLEDRRRSQHVRCSKANSSQDPNSENFVKYS